MRIVGLTGGIASGKSTVTAQLQSHNIPVVDCDLIAREVVAPGTPVLTQIKSTFGNQVILPNGSLNRAALGNIIFNDKAQNAKLGKIMGSAIHKQIVWQVVRAFFGGAPLVVIDAPTLFETKSLISMCGEIIVVAVDKDVQLKRLMARDQSSEQEAMSRINSQLPMKMKIEHPNTTEVLCNNGTRDELKRSVHNVIARLQARAGLLHRLLTLPGMLLVLGVGGVLYNYSRL